MLFLTARGPGWAASHHTGSKDTALSLTRRCAGGALTLRQAVPGGRWFLVPTPAARWVRRVDHGRGAGAGAGEGAGADVIALEADALTRTAGASQTFYSGDGFKAGLGVSASAGGGKAFSLCARQKLRGAGPLHSIGGAYHSVAGPEVTAKVRPGKGVCGRLVFWPRTGVAALSAYASPAWLTQAVGGGGGGAAKEGARKGTITLDARVPVVDRAGGGKAFSKPAGLLGLKWKF